MVGKEEDRERETSMFPWIGCLLHEGEWIGAGDQICDPGTCSGPGIKPVIPWCTGRSSNHWTPKPGKSSVYLNTFYFHNWTVSITVCIHFLGTPCIFIEIAGFTLQKEHCGLLVLLWLGVRVQETLVRRFLPHITEENRIQIYIKGINLACTLEKISQCCFSVAFPGKLSRQCTSKW